MRLGESVRVTLFGEATENVWRSGEGIDRDRD